MLGLGDPLRGYGLRMMQNFVTDFAFVQTIEELQWYFHNWLDANYHFPARSLLPARSESATKIHKFLELRSLSSGGISDPGYNAL